MVRIKDDPVIEISFKELLDKFPELKTYLTQGYSVHKFFVDSKKHINTDKRPLVIKLLKR